MITLSEHLQGTVKEIRRYVDHTWNHWLAVGMISLSYGCSSGITPTRAVEPEQTPSAPLVVPDPTEEVIALPTFDGERQDIPVSESTYPTNSLKFVMNPVSAETIGDLSEKAEKGSEWMEHLLIAKTWSMINDERTKAGLEIIPPEDYRKAFAENGYRIINTVNKAGDGWMRVVVDKDNNVWADIINTQLMPLEATSMDDFSLTLILTPEGTTPVLGYDEITDEPILMYQSKQGGSLVSWYNAQKMEIEPRTPSVLMGIEFDETIELGQENFAGYKVYRHEGTIMMVLDHEGREVTPDAHGYYLINNQSYRWVNEEGRLIPEIYEAPIEVFDQITLNINGKPVEYVIGTEVGETNVKSLFQKQLGINRIVLNRQRDNLQEQFGKFVSATFWQAAVYDDTSYDTFMANPKDYSYRNIPGVNEFTFDEIKEVRHIFIHPEDARFERFTLASGAKASYSMKDGIFTLYSTISTDPNDSLYFAVKMPRHQGYNEALGYMTAGLPGNMLLLRNINAGGDALKSWGNIDRVVEYYPSFSYGVDPAQELSYYFHHSFWTVELFE
jgi:hypothetical protein